MPAYDYTCPSCGTDVEVTKPMGDPDPSCGTCGTVMRRRFSAVGIAFKGSGFYKTDSRRSSSAA